MTAVAQALRATTEMAGVLPRSVTALRASGIWEPLSWKGMR
jgi:hypothetical protein